MGEIKSVKVDNWGVFFLQKLQNFFNKTDYCDLTLQFNDNSQLKVHRLVLSACTDYFNVLEQTCDVVDDALIMPNELQADVVVPIVNFMYTGTLEFELKMYGKLLRTAKEMNMTVLLKLLEAHRRTMEGVNRAQRPASPKTVRKRGPVTITPSNAPIRPLTNSAQQQQQRRILTAANAMAQRRLVQIRSFATDVSQPHVQQYRSSVPSASLLKASTAASSHRPHRTTSEAASYTGDSTAYEPEMQFKEEQNDDYDTQLTTINQSTSPFEQLRKGYNNNKRPASATFISPPAKKPNIEDVKEFAEQQRMRKQIAAEYGEDQEYESTMLDDDIHNDDDDDDTAAAPSSSSIPVAPAPTTPVKQQQQQQQSGPSIIIKQEPNEKPTIVVKDSSNSKMNHAKIISEVLRQYPHLVKSNKNIKLKIMPNSGGQSQKIIMKKEQIGNISPDKNAQSVSATSSTTQTVLKPISTQQKSVQPQIQKMTSVAPAAAAETISSQTSTATTGAQTQKRRIDSKTMHALIALGAENTTGPWLCLRCGVNGRPISIPSYRGFRRHLINTHKEAIDPALCEHCGWRSTTNRELHFHIQVEHKINTTLYTYPDCLVCSDVFVDTNALNQHMIDSHPEENQQQCIYCNKIFAKELQLYTHMKTYHKIQAIDDGIIDYSEEDDDDDGEDEPMDSQENADCADEKDDSLLFSMNKKINILSDISLPSASSLLKIDRPRSGSAALTKIASGIASNIGLETSQELSPDAKGVVETISSEPKFVSADGNEMVLTDEQRKEIMSQLNQDHEGGVVMLLNESAFADTDVAATITNEEASADESAEQTNTEHETEEQQIHAGDASANEDDTSDYDDNNIYGEFVSKVDVENKKEAGLDESKGSADNLEWAENLLTAHELEDEEEEEEEEEETERKQAEKVVDKTQNVNDSKPANDISQKLKELTGDWSDDEIDEDEGEEEEEEEVKPSTELSIHKECEIEEKQSEETGKAFEVVASETIEQNLEEEEVQVKIIEKIEDVPEEEKMDCKQIEEEPEDDIDIALESLHKEIETKVENVVAETHGAVASTGSSANVEESEDDNYRQAESKEVLNKSDESLEIPLESTSDKSSSLVEEASIETKSIDVEASEKEEETIEIDHQEDEMACVKKDLAEEDDIKIPVEEANVDVDTEMQNAAAETKAVEIETKKDIEIKEITKEEPDESPTEFASVTSKTEEKIKTLISEWGEDDDDEVDDVVALE